jgi:5'-deoxynucleotidase YfbR-like HD superfamily hydrolase
MQNEELILDEFRLGGWLQTFTGGEIWPIDPRPEEINIVDIAQALSQQCRYAGHTTRFYSVAEHSVYISREVPAELALWGLLHDASEAYLVDIPRPLKPYMPVYKHWERELMQVIAAKFGLSWQNRL